MILLKYKSKCFNLKKFLSFDMIACFYLCFISGVLSEQFLVKVEDENHNDTEATGEIREIKRSIKVKIFTKHYTY